MSLAFLIHKNTDSSILIVSRINDEDYEMMTEYL